MPAGWFGRTTPNFSYSLPSTSAEDLRMQLEEVARVLAALADALAAVAEPGAALLDELFSTARSSRSPSREMPCP